MIDAAMVVSDALNAAGLGAPSFMEVPADRPDAFFLVTQTGGSWTEGVIESADVDIDAWAATRREAAALSDGAQKVVMALPERDPKVFHSEVVTTYYDPDLDSGAPRHVSSVRINFCR